MIAGNIVTATDLVLTQCFPNFASAVRYAPPRSREHPDHRAKEMNKQHIANFELWNKVTEKLKKMPKNQYFKLVYLNNVHNILQ